MTHVETRLRRPPKQYRSRERVEEILAAAKRLVGEKGIDAVKMREIAELTGGPISSIYQYFPNKSAIIAMLFQQWTQEIEGMIEQRLESVSSLDGLGEAAADFLDYYYDRITSEPAILDLLNAIQADKTLKNLDIDSTRKQSAIFCQKGSPYIATARFEAFCRIAFLMFQLANGAVRLALSEGPAEAGGILADYKLIIRGQLSLFATPSSLGGTVLGV